MRIALAAWIAVLTFAVAGCSSPATNLSSTSTTTQPNTTTAPLESDPAAVDVIQTGMMQVVDGLGCAGDALAAEDFDGARDCVDGAKDGLLELYGALYDKRALLSAHDAHLYDEVTTLLALFVDATSEATSWAQSFTENVQFYEQATNADEKGLAIASLELSLQSGRNAAQDLRDAAAHIRQLLRDDPDTATEMSLSEADAQTQESSADEVDTNIGQVNDYIAQAKTQGDYQPPAQDALPEGSTVKLPEGLVSAGLQAFFATFDADHNGNVDRTEAAAFYYWVEGNIPYRYDDENAPKADPRYAIGDGRPGNDYHQTPDETYNERAGDCEDANMLEVAFYNYWGIAAAQAYVNAETDVGFDHAIAIVLVGSTVDEAQQTMGRVDYYEFDASNTYGLKAGVYAIVDNAYSNDFGFISDGIAPGKFQILQVHFLGESYTQVVT
ncbi:MAG: hypothetical protein V4510_11185 [bacterium]